MKKILSAAIIIVIAALVYFFVVRKTPTENSPLINNTESSTSAELGEKLDGISDQGLKYEKAVKPIDTDDQLLETEVAPKFVEQQKSQIRLSKELESRYSELSNNEKYPTLALRMEALKNRKATQDISPEKILSLLAQSNAWVSVDTPGKNIALIGEFLDDGRVFLRVTPDKFATLLEGDTIGLTVSQLGQTFVTEINSVNDSGDEIVFESTVIDPDTGGEATLNYSMSVIDVNISVDGGEFTMQSIGSDGWILDSALVFD